MPAPTDRGGGQQRRVERVVHEVGHDLARSQQCRVERQRRTESQADRRGVDDDVGAGRRRRRCRPWRPPRGGAASCARCRVRLTTTMLAGAGAPEGVDHAAGRGAGADHRHHARRRGRRPPRPARRRSRHRRCCGRSSSPPSATTTVLTDRSAVAAGASSSTAAATSSLCGVVTDSPRSPSTRIASTAAAARPGATSKATYAQSRPAACEGGVVDGRRQRVGDRRADHAPATFTHG